MKPRKQKPGYPDYVKKVRSRGRYYEYFDTGRDVNGKRVYKPLPPQSDDSYGGTYASLLAARMARENLVDIPSVSDVSRAYQRSPAYMKRSESTQATYLTYLRVVEEEMGEAPIDDIERADIQKLLDKMQDRPGAANMVLLVLRNLVKYAKKRDWLKVDPTDGIDALETGDAEYEPWDEGLLADALNDPGIGLAVALLYYTGQRIGDVCKMRWSDIRDGYLIVKQQKTGKTLDIRLHTELHDMLRATPRDAMTILHGPKLRPARAATLRLHLKKWAADRGFNVVPHGLRKNAVNALLENECSIAEVSSITGQSLEMVEHYAKRRNNKRIGSAAILKWERGTKRGNGKQWENG